MNKKYKEIFKLVKVDIKMYVLLFFIISIQLFINIKLINITKNIIDIGVINADTFFIIKSLLTYFILIISYFFLNYFGNKIHIKIGLKISISLRTSFIDNLISLSGKELYGFQTGDLSIRLINEIEKIQNFISNFLISIIIDILYAITMIIVLFNINKSLLSINIISVLILLLINIIFGNKIKKGSIIVRNSYKDLSNKSFQLLNNLVTTLLNGSIHFIRNEIFKSQYKLNEKYTELYKLNFLLQFLQGIVESSIIILTLGYGGYLVVQNKITIGGLITFNLYIGKAISPIIRVLKSHIQFKEIDVIFDRIFEIINMKSSIKQNSFREIPQQVLDVTFNNVTFSYDKNPVLDNISFKAEIGEIVGIIGKSGTGKTTIVNLLFRLWESDNGTININNVDIENISINSLRDKISVMSQDIMIFNDSFIRNLTLDKEIPLETVKKVCQSIGIDEFIQSKPQGYKTLIEENGADLSGGQKQKLALARTFIQDKDIIILDEPTSSLDIFSEKQVIKYIKSISSKKIIIVITHRLSLKLMFDKILYTSNEQDFIQDANIE